jgi:alpha-galactosidase
MPEVLIRDGDAGPVIENGTVRLSVHLNRGTFDVAAIEDGPGSLTAAAASVLIEGAPVITTRGAGMTVEREEDVDGPLGRGRGVVLARESDEGEPELLLTVSLVEGQSFATASVEVVNRGRAPLSVSAFHVVDGAKLDLGVDPQALRFYKEGWQDWSPALVLPVSGEDVPMSPPVVAPRTQPEPREGRFLSELMTVVASPGGPSLLAGFASSAEQFSQVWLDRDGAALTAASYGDGVRVAPGGRMSSETLVVEPAGSPLEAMRRFGRSLGSVSDAVTWPEPVAGWCSWYYYFHAVSEAEVIANLDEIAARRRELPFAYVQIDDGYQAEIGDWLTPNEKFPHGMGWAAELIHDRGLKAGLWLAPFLIGENSQLWKDHPDWAVQYKPGTPMVAMLNWQQRCYALDLTLPDVLDWLRHVFRTIFDEWGYDYVKIDFIYAGAVDGIRHGPDLTRAQAYRRGIDTIREAAGDRFILGCGQPIGPSIGVVNGARIGPDVAPFWHPMVRSGERDDMSSVSTLNALRNVLSRWWMHGSLWLNDPDCLMVRGDETALTLDEVRTLATVIGLSGGMVLDSDNLARLTDERREIISMLLPVYGRSAVPLDLFTAEGMPTLFELECGTHRMLGVFNWGEEAADVVVPLPAEDTHVFEVWESSYKGILTGETTVPLPAHGCALLALRPALGRPQVVGSTIHLLQGAMEIAGEEWGDDELRVRLRPVAKAEGEIFIASGPDSRMPQSPGAAVVQRADGVWSVACRVDRDEDLVVSFH